MTTYPLPTLSATITDTGISAPSYSDILLSLKATYASIFGSDAYLEADSQDGQWLAAMASAINDSNSLSISVYNAFSPATAQGVGLSSVVQINGISRQVSSSSTVDVTIVGVAGTTITNGKVTDGTYNWSLPASVVIPLAGEIDVTATCDTEGSIVAGVGDVNGIITPTLGWQTVTNAAIAATGDPVETDAALRQRQALSTSLSAETPLRAVSGALSALSGVTRVAAYENDTGSINADGLPAHSIAMVVEGGDSTEIAIEILNKKTIGAATYGSTTIAVPDVYGVPRNINFDRPVQVLVSVEVTITDFVGYTSVIGDQILSTVAAYLNALDIGDDVITTRLYMPSNLYGATGVETFEVNLIRVKKNAGAFGTADIVIAYKELAASSAMTLIVL